MDRALIQSFLDAYSETSPTNYLQPKISDAEAAAQTKAADMENDVYLKHNYIADGAYDASIFNSNKDEKYIGMRFFNKPVFAVGRADDPGFKQLLSPGVVGGWHSLPTDWVADAKSVISIFFPYSDRTLDSNKEDPEHPSAEWMFARMDGQKHLNSAAAEIVEMFRREGYTAVAPQLDSRYMTQHSARTQPEEVPLYTSNWSERHVGYVVGLGTFGLNTHFISKIGCAGRLISLITNWECEPDAKDYSDYLDYCNKCGACIRRCPAGVLHEDCSKDKANCVVYIRKVSKPFPGRIGCGKCQSGIPCDRRHF